MIDKLKDWKLWLRISVTIGILAMLAVVLPVDKLIRIISSIAWSNWVLVIICVLIGHVISSYKWRLLLQASGISLSVRDALLAHAAGLFANLCMPSIVGGDVLKISIIAKKHGRLSAVTIVTVTDRLIDMLALITVAAIASLFLPATVNEVTTQVFSFIGFALFLASLTGVILLRWFRTRILPPRIIGIARRMKDAIISLSAKPRAATFSFLLSVSIQGIFALLNVFLARAIGMDATIWILVWAWALSKIIALLPVSLSGIGVREIAFAGLLAPFGIEASHAVAQSLSWEVILIATGLISGSAVLFIFGQKMSLFNIESKQDK